MGFYIQMVPQTPGTNLSPEAHLFQEETTPPVFWILFLIAGFALTCMGLAANHLLVTLAKSGGSLDRVIVFVILGFIPFYFLAGLKFLVIRKFIRWTDDGVQVGYRLGQRTLFRRTIASEAICGVDLVNQRPTANLAVRQHADRQYHIRGHWRAGLKLRDGRFVTLDRHTEREALLPLFESLKESFTGGKADETARSS